ncbi:MAG: hypothetical protein H6727_18825 [Myxococcales bacterium]|nr:hypothetical protein [Myxococcales bacterium]
MVGSSKGFSGKKPPVPPRNRPDGRPPVPPRRDRPVLSSGDQSSVPPQTTTTPQLGGQQGLSQGSTTPNQTVTNVPPPMSPGHVGGSSPIEQEIPGPPPSYSRLAHQPNHQASAMIGVPSHLPVDYQAPVQGEKASTLFGGNMFRPPVTNQPPTSEKRTGGNMPTYPPPEIPNSQSSPSRKEPSTLPDRSHRNARYFGYQSPVLPPQPNTNTPSMGPVSSPLQAASSQQVGGVQSTQPHVVTPQRQELDGLIDQVATGQLTTPDEIYKAYNAQDNPLQSKSKEQYAEDVRLLGEQFKPGGGRVSDFDAKDGKVEGYYQFSAPGMSMNQTQQRVYLNAKSDHAPEVMGHVVGSYLGQNNPGVTGAKIWSPEDVQTRNDAIVIYTNGPEATQQVVDGLRNYQQANADKFHANVPLMTKPQEGTHGVSIGDDPNTDGIDYDRLNGWVGGLGEGDTGYDIAYQTNTWNSLMNQMKPSFGQIRADTVWLAAQDPQVKDGGQINPEKLRGKTNELLDILNIDPQDPSKNLR